MSDSATSDSAEPDVSGAQWVTFTAEQAEWVQGPYGETAVVWGNPTSGPYGSFNRIPAGTVIPPHLHTHDNQLVVIEGTVFSYRVDDDEQTRSRALPAGSVIYEVATAPHVLAISDDGPAMIYSTQTGPLDLTLVEDDDPGHG